MIDLALFAMAVGLIEHGAVSGPNCREVVQTVERIAAERAGALRTRLTAALEDLKAYERR